MGEEGEVAVDSAEDEYQEEKTIEEYVDAEGITGLDKYQEEINILQEEINLLEDIQEYDEEIQEVVIDEIVDVIDQEDNLADANSSWTIATTRMPRTKCEHVDIGRTMHIMSFTINGKCTDHMNLHVGDSARLRVVWDNLETQCTGCIEQMYVGMRGQQLDCIFSENSDGDTTGYYDFNTGPLTAGDYSLVASSSWQYDCVDRTDGVVLATLLVDYPKTPGFGTFVFFLAIIGIISIVGTIFYAVKHYLSDGMLEKLEIHFSDLPTAGTRISFDKDDPELGGKKKTVEFEPLNREK